MAAGIDCVAVTDHNSGEWIDKLKSAYATMKAQADAGTPPAGFRELYLFPGVEITVSGGFHLLAILDPSAATSDIDTLLGKVDYRDTKGDSDGVTRKGATEVIEAITEAGAIAIPAHADQDNGLLQVVPETRRSKLNHASVRQVLATNKIIAVEWCDTNNPVPAGLEPLTSPLALVLGSDCHSFQGNNLPGSRYTWIKMARPDLEGLRLALLDGNDISVRRSDENGFDPSQLPEQFITRLEVEEARYMGRSTPQVMAFSPFFNGLIGGRGTGKSTVVHLLRLAYRRESELASLLPETEPRKQFESFRKIVKGRRGDGGLQDRTEIRVELRRDGIAHRLRWRADSQDSVVEERDASGNWFPSASQVINPERFPIRLFSQGQIAAMAGEDRQALLTIIDEAAQLAPRYRTLDDLKRTYFSQRARLRELDGKLDQRSEVERQLADIVRKLDAFQQSHHADILKAHQQAIRQQRDVDETLEQLKALPGHIDSLAQEVLLDDWSEAVFDEELDRDILNWRRQLDLRVQQAREVLEQVSRTLGAATMDLQQDAEFGQWRIRIARTTEDYEALKTTLAEQGVEDPKVFSNLIQERQQLEAQVKQLDQWQVDRDALLRDSEAQFQRLLLARQAITEKRAQFLCSTLANNPFVQITVEPFGHDPPVIENSLRELLGASEHFDKDILLRADDGEPCGGLAHDIASASARDRGAALAIVKQKLGCVDEGGFNGHFTNHLRKTHRKPEFIDHIQCWFPEDDLRISYSRKGNGKGFTPISQGSPGQRAAALLAFLLAFGNEPMVLDQPEDDLDNHLIYELIVRQIRENKRRRQLIIVTHNPNVVVNGDAEMVHAFDFNGQCHVREQGALQEKKVRDEVCHVMEGGREAFSRRWMRLGREA